MRLTAAGAVFLLIITLVPLLRLTVYAVPWYDDYNYGSIIKGCLQEDYSVMSALKGAVFGVRREWYAWQGTFSSIFFMILMPAVWGEQYYFLGPVFLIVLLTVSVYVFVRTLLSCMFQADRLSGIALSALVTTMVLMLIYSAQTGFYWYNGGVHYVGMHSFMLLLAAAWIKMLTGKGKISAVFLFLWSLLGAVLAGGANYVTALQGLLLGLSLVALGLLLRKTRVFLLMPSLFVYGFAFYKNIIAPGNNTRKNALGWKQGDALSAILNSFVEAIRHTGIFTGPITIAIMILLIPLICYIVKRTKFTFRFPGLISLWSFCLFATGFTPSLYVLGNAGLSRTLNAVKITFQLLLLFNEIYWIGYLQKERHTEEQERPCVWWFYPLVGSAMLLIFCLTSNQAGNYSAYGAYYYVHTGEAYNFHQEYLERVELLKSEEPNVVLKPYVYRPWFLCAGELSDDPDNESNRSLASWYGKSSVICIEEKE